MARRPQQKKTAAAGAQPAVSRSAYIIKKASGGEDGVQFKKGQRVEVGDPGFSADMAKIFEDRGLAYRADQKPSEAKPTGATKAELDAQKSRAQKVMEKHDAMNEKERATNRERSGDEGEDVI